MFLFVGRDSAFLLIKYGWFQVTKNIFKHLLTSILTLAGWDIAYAVGWSMWRLFSLNLLKFSAKWPGISLNKNYFVKGVLTWVRWKLKIGFKTIFFKITNDFSKIFILIMSVKIKLRIITKNMASVQQYSFLKNRFYCQWSSQRPSASVKVHFSMLKFYKKFCNKKCLNIMLSLRKK